MENIEENRETLLNSLPWAARPVWRGVDTGPGWFNLIAELNKHLTNLYPDYEVVQVKEKFGTLRYYTNGIPYREAGEATVGAGLIQQAEIASSKICDACGRPGSLKKRGYWLATRCDAEACTVTDRGTFIPYDEPWDEDEDDES